MLGLILGVMEGRAQLSVGILATSTVAFPRALHTVELLWKQVSHREGHQALAGTCRAWWIGGP